jgi:prepilin-type N-terminal cleavage/methylation domain-containing protein
MKKRGFTLVELLAVIAIISILATIGVTAVIKVYNNSVKKTMIVQENNVAEASKSYLEDYCIDPLDNTYKCPSSYENNSEIRYICLSDLQDNEKGNYVSKVNYKNEDCKGIIIFSKNDDGDYYNAKTYLYCDYDTKDKKYNYVTDESLDTSKYPRCNIASGITEPGETTSTTSTTTTTTTKKV